MILQRTNTILYCHHWAETVAFYRDVFDFTINFQNEWFVEFRITDSAYLSVADARRATIESVNGQGITLAWQVADVKEAHAALKQQGIAVTDIRSKWGAHLFYLHDPEGHRIELWQ